MTSYIISVNERTNKAKTFLRFIKDYAKDNPFVSLEPTPNAATRKAIDNARKGKTVKVKNAKALFDSI